MAAALTVLVPAVYLAIDRSLGLPNAARWIGNGLMLIAAYRQDGLYDAMPGGSSSAARDRHRWMLVYLVLTLGLMAWMLALAHLRVSTVSFDIRRVSPVLITYRVLYLTFFAVVLVRMISTCSRYRRTSHDATVKLAMVLDMVGAAWAIVYLVATLLVALLPGSAPAAAPLRITIQVSILFAVVFLLTGTTISIWGPRVGVPTLLHQVSMLLAYRRLSFLWHALVAEAPTVVLPMPVSWRSALLTPETMDLLLYRRVIEILDAWRQLDGIREVNEAVIAASARASLSGATIRTPAPNEQTYGTQGASATDAQSPPEALERRAQTDAHHLMETLQYLRQHPGHQEVDLSPVRGMVTAYRPTTYVEQMHYLERVARYVRMELRPRPVWRRWAGSSRV